MITQKGTIIFKGGATFEITTTTDEKTEITQNWQNYLGDPASYQNVNLGFADGKGDIRVRNDEIAGYFWEAI